MDKIDYSTFAYLYEKEFVSFLNDLAKHMRSGYRADCSRNICITSKFANKIRLKEWAFDNFPMDSNAMEVWLNTINITNDKDFPIKIGKNEEIRILKNGLNDIGK